MRHIPLTLLVGLTLIACDDPLYGVPVVRLGRVLGVVGGVGDCAHG